MATSSCPKCGQHLFQMIEQEPGSAAYKYLYHQCSSCGTVVGVTEFYNLGAIIKETPDSVFKRLDHLSQQLQNLEHAVAQIQNEIQRLK